MRADIVVIGAGASGMISAILLARAGKKVVLIEAQNRGGKKILASGNGHCNIANSNVSSKNFYAKNSQLIKTILNVKVQEIVELFASLGLQIITKEDGKMYPASMQASAVLELLEQEIKRLNIEIFYNVKDLKVQKGFKLQFGVTTLQAKSLILATGSQAAPQLGGNNSGLNIAKSFGHTIVEPTPSLVPLASSVKICKKLAGVKVKARVRLFVDEKETASEVGDFLFAKYGVSGLTILDLSLKASLALKAKKSVYILVDFFAQYNKQELLEYLKSLVDKKRNLPLAIWLSGIINSKLAKELLEELNLEQNREANLNSKMLKSIVELFKNYKIVIDETRDFKYAEVAYGGVNSNEIDSQSLESKKQKGLYFAGEVLDVVAQRGGYNFYFAWSSAMLCSTYLGAPKS